MQGSKLHEWLLLFDAPQKRQLRKFVHSPYFNEHQAVQHLLDILLSGRLEKQAIWAEMFPGKTYNDLRMRHLSNLLLTLCEQFAAIQRFESQHQAVQAECLAALREQGSAGLRAYTARKFQRQHPSIPGPDSLESFHHHFRFQAELLENVQDVAQRSAGSLLQPVLEQLDQYYFLAKLMYGCTILNNQRIVDAETHNALMPAIFEAMDRHTQALNPIVDLYRHLHEMLEAPADMATYTRMRELLDRHGPSLPPNTARDLYTLTMNHCIGRINAGQLQFQAELFGLYQIALARGFLIQNGFLSPWNYKNITVTGLRLGEFAWVEEFIHSHQHLLAPEHRFNAFTYNLARLHFHRRQYPIAKKLLQQIAFDDVFYSLDSKVILLKIYFETQEDSALDALIDSFRSLLRRNRLISEHHRSNYLNLIRFVRKISRVLPGDSKRLAEIRASLEACEQVADKGWLRQKVQELE